MHELVRQALEAVTRGYAPEPALLAQIAEALASELPAMAADLMAVARLAGSLRSKAPFACGIVNAKSGRCAENCAFCAQSAHHATAVLEYPLLSSAKLLRRAAELADAGVEYLGIVCSGTAPSQRDFSRICAAAGRIRARHGLRLCASLGLLSGEQAGSLREAGFTSYHHNLETAASFYAGICSTHAFTARLATVRNALAAGLRVCSGGIFGLGESWAQRLELALTLGELGVHSVPVNFLNPIPGTPLAGASPLPPLEALAVVSLLRLALPEQDLVICGGRAKTLGGLEHAVLLAGANGLMVGDYLTTGGSAWDQDRAMLVGVGWRKRT